MSRTPAVVDVCPECNEIGRLNPFWPKGATKRHFVMVHGELDHTWGTSIKRSEQVVARDRCYLVKPAHRLWAAHKLGFDLGFGAQSTLG
jgi:hypothetical protein